MLYEKLNDDMRQMVDTYAERLAGLDWSRRGDLLGQAAIPFAESLDEEQARLAGKGFVTAVLERLPDDETAEVTDAHQAVIFSLSLDEEHRAAAKSFLDKHPEIGAVVEAELGDGDGEAN
ncbi:MAG TPA: hypothetical protein VKU40_08110 [Thermoanaerobaculia bacterium]|nr:hypothetical protein [Thermoanaerobaculia bacterium]